MSLFLAIVDPVCEFLSLGAVARLGMTCKSVRESVSIPAILCSKLNLKKRLPASLGAYMRTYLQRCIECGKYRHTGLARRFGDTRVCLACARDRTNYRYHPTKPEAVAIIRSRNRGFLPKQRVLDERMPPRMLTQRRQYLYRLSDVMTLCQIFT